MGSSPSITASLHRLSASFVLGYHGCDAAVAELLLQNHSGRDRSGDRLGICLDLTTSLGLRTVRAAYVQMTRVSEEAGFGLPRNFADGRHNLDCAVINYLHRVREADDIPFDTVKGIFTEDPLLYPGSAFGSKNHIQIAVRNPACIKGVFRVADADLDPTV